MGFIRDFSISYVAGVVGSLAVIFSLDKNNALQSGVFWFYFITLYSLVIIIHLFLTKILFKKSKKN